MKIRMYQFDEDGFMRLQKDINALINERNMDHTHVARLYTEYCDIQSEAGETVIDGPLLTMRSAASTTIRLLQGYDPSTGDFVNRLYDANGNIVFSVNTTGQVQLSGKPYITMTDDTTTIRLKLGYNQVTNQFEYALYNVLGAQTFGVDSSGDGTFTGTITGGVIRTASTGARIQLSSNTLATFSSNNVLNGLVTENTTGQQFGDVYIYDAGTKMLEFYNNLTGAGISIRPTNSAWLYLGGPSTSIVMMESTNFYLQNTDSTSVFKPKGYIDEFAKNITWNSGTRTLTLLDSNGATLASVVISA
jgi:hypothetical protein